MKQQSITTLRDFEMLVKLIYAKRENKKLSEALQNCLEGGDEIRTLRALESALGKGE